MSAEKVLARLRLFLLALAGSLFAGSVLELIFAEHVKDTVQWIPFVLCALGVVAVAAVYFAPARRTVFWLRVCMGTIALGSLIGVYEHIRGNLDFALEIMPNATWTELVIKTLTGANPLLAPGILILAATLAVAATYEHPVLT